MTKQKNQKTKAKKPAVKKVKIKTGVIVFLSLLGITIIGNILLSIYFNKRSFPNTYVAGYNVGSKTAEEVLEKIRNNFVSPEYLVINVKDRRVELTLKDIELRYDLDKTALLAVQGNKHTNFIINLLYAPQNLLTTHNFPLKYNIDDKKLDEFIDILINENSTLPTDYSVEIEGGQIVVNKGLPGEVIEKGTIKIEILEAISSNNFHDFDLNFYQVDTTIDEHEADSLQKRASDIIGKSFELSHEYDSISINDSDLVSFLGKKHSYKEDIIKNFIKNEVIQKIERDPQNAQIVIDNNKIVEFTPAKDGISVDEEQLAQKILDKLQELENDDVASVALKIPIISAKPEIALSDVNNLGITELIGRGVSQFHGSISSRIFNIGHASKKFKSVLVGPGETFSFNNILGDVSSLTGYKQAYIIQNGRTVLGDGGGVCQVSTTLFRAALDAGLPIVERRAHSYRVGYYEQNSAVGLDATVYYPTTDFKFKNDTPGHILIQSVFDPNNYTLVFEIYGTSDGRTATISDSIISEYISPPEDLYVDDPSLPAGQIKQIDFKAWGAKVSFNYKVERNGQTLIDKNFISNYRPWQSVFLRGTGSI